LQNSSCIVTNATKPQTWTVLNVFASLFGPTQNQSTEISSQIYKTSPLTVTINDFILKLNHKENWQSEPFLAFERGYLMYLSIYPAGYGYAEGSHVSVYLNLMKGPYDDELEQSGHWPLRRTFTVVLYSSYHTEYHYYISPDYSVCDWCTFRVREGNEAPNAWGVPEYLHHDILMNASEPHFNSVYFHISYSSHANISIEKIWQQRQQHIVKYLIQFLINIFAVILNFPTVYIGKLVSRKVTSRFDISYSTIFSMLKDLAIPMVMVILLKFADVCVITISDSMDIDDSASAPLHCMLLRMCIAADFLHRGNEYRIILLNARILQKVVRTIQAYK